MRHATIVVIGSFVFSLLQIDWAEARHNRRQRRCQPCYEPCYQPCFLDGSHYTIHCPTQYVSTSSDSMGNKWDTWECSSCFSNNGKCASNGTASEPYEENPAGTLVPVTAYDCTKCSCPMAGQASCSDTYCRVYSMGMRISRDTKNHLGAKGLKSAPAKLEHKFDGKYTFRELQVIFVKNVKGQNVLRYADVLIATEKNANQPPIAYGFEIAGDVPDGFVGLKTTRPDPTNYPYVYWIDFEDVSGSTITGSIIAAQE